MTAPQREALKLLAEEPRETTKTTHHGYVAGIVMKSLTNRRWAEIDSRRAGTLVYRITEAGRRALRYE